MIKRNHHQIMLSSIRKMFSIIIFTFHADINCHDNMITTPVQRIRYDTVHMLIKIEIRHDWPGFLA